MQNPQAYQASIDQYNQMADEIVARIERSEVGTEKDRQTAAQGARTIQRTTGRDAKQAELEKVLNQLSPQVRRAAREILQALVSQGPSTKPSPREQKLIDKARKASGSA